MTEFSKCFDKIVKCRGLRCVQVAEECNMDTSVIFRWQTGKVLPGSWERLEAVIERLRFTSYEVSRLKNAYRREVLGANRSRRFDEVVETIQILGETQRKRGVNVQKELSSVYEIHFRNPSNMECEFLEMESKAEVWQCIQNLLEIMSVQKDGRLCLRLQGFSEILLMQLKQFGSKMTGGRLEILVCDSDKAEDIKLEKLKRMKEMTDLLAQGSCGNIFCCNLWDTEELQGNWIMSKDFFMQFSDDMSQGMLTRNAEWIVFFQESFDRVTKGRFCNRKKLSWAEYIEREQEELCEKESMIGYMPSVGNILAEMEEFFGKGLDDVETKRQLLSCFTREGLLEFLEGGDMEMESHPWYRSLDMRQRRELLEHAVSLAEQVGSVRYIMLKEDVLDLRGICVRLRYGGEESLRMDVCPGRDGIEEIETSDTDIIRGYENFFESLPESGLAYGEKETRKIMREMLKAYGDDGA